MDTAVRIQAVQRSGCRGLVVRHRSDVAAPLRIAAAVVHPDPGIGEDRRKQLLLGEVGVQQGEPVLNGQQVTAAAAGTNRCGDSAELVAPSTAVGGNLDDGAGEHVDQQQPVVRRVPERALAVKGAGVREPLRPCTHCQPPSTIHRCAVQARESSAASQSSSRATSSG